MEEFLTIEALLIVLVLVATLVAIAVRRIRLPYTVSLVWVGLFISIQRPIAVEVTPELILSIFVPPLIFEAAFHLDYRLLRKKPGFYRHAGGARRHPDHAVRGGGWWPFFGHQPASPPAPAPGPSRSVGRSRALRGSAHLPRSHIGVARQRRALESLPLQFPRFRFVEPASTRAIGLA